jgi:light-regulated signal transduction histidine kinase (bacteriophytochrome)
MSWDWNVLGEAGLQFFGKMSASISHEIKNALAIINESAGLLDDLSLRAEKGIPVEPERLKKQAGNILKQIRRADGIIQNMNKFAHSIDEPMKNVDIGETVTLMAALSDRFAMMKGITLERQPPASPVTVCTNPFFLENLLYLCLNFCMDNAGPGKTISLVAGKTESGAGIRFSRIDGLAEVAEGVFPGERVTVLLSALGAKLEVSKESKEISITLSGKLA